MQGLLIDLSSQIGVTHDEGPEGVAWAEETLETQLVNFDPVDFSVQLRGISVSSIARDGFILGDESAWEITSAGTASVTNTDPTITLSGAPDLTTTALAAGDTFELQDPTNEANRITGIVQAPITSTTFEAEDSDGNPLTVWTNESGISYRLVIGHLNATDVQKEYGHLADEATGNFADGTDGQVLI